MSRELVELKADNETFVEFVESEYVIGWFELKVEDYVHYCNFAQESTTYHQKLQRIFETVWLEAGKN